MNYKNKSTASSSTGLKRFFISPRPLDNCSRYCSTSCVHAVVCTLWLVVLNVQSAYSTEISLVAVASNMTQVFTELTEQYDQNKQGNIRLVFGSSGNFARQIVQGAPFEIFLSANRKFVDFLIDNHVALEQDTQFASGKIGYFIPNDSSLSHNNSLSAINKSLAKSEYTRMAIANPEIAPYGVAAQQALQSAGLWVLSHSKLILGENVAQAMQFTLSGGVDIGIVPASYAMLPETKGKGRFITIPESWHKPIIQYLVLKEDASSMSKEFYRYLLSESSRTIIEKYGYSRSTD